MAMTPEDIRTLNAEMDALGEIQVRHLMIGEHWGAPDSIRRTYVDAWLQTKESERDRDFAASASRAAISASKAVVAARDAEDSARSASEKASEALRVARQARTAAIVAATAVIIVAIAAIIVAVVAIIK